MQNLESLSSIKNLSSLVKYLRDELDWEFETDLPIKGSADKILAFHFSPVQGHTSTRTLASRSHDSV